MARKPPVPMEGLFQDAPTPAGSTVGNAPKKPSRAWTKEQRLGIETTGKSLLVSAAAGSGKTAVLSERCAHLVCDADPPCEVDELLVVTFTEAAAAEMKARIEQALRDRLSNGETKHLTRQLALIEHAQVSTLHAFCSKVLRQHFHLVGLDPGFAILDGDEAALMRIEVARQLFLDRYESDESGDFQHLIDAYGEGNDERLVQQVIRAHNLLGSLIDPAGWRAKARQRIFEATQVPLKRSELGRVLFETIERDLRGVRDRCAAARDLIGSLDGFGKYLDQLREFATVIDHWLDTFQHHGLDALAEVVKDLQIPRLPTIPNTVPNKDLAKSAMDAIKDELKEGKLRQSLEFSEHEWVEGLRSILPSVDVLLELIEEFGQRYEAAKDATRSLDFTDLERLTLRVLRDPNKPDALGPSSVARQYHRQFHHVLVDEYQDINEVQDAILCLVSRECVCDEGQVGNLFCVGDVKQSIYRFRLAEPARFLARHRTFTAAGGGSRGLVIDLQANFRSRKPLLDAANAVFERLMTEEAADIEYDQTHRLRAGLDYPIWPDGDGFTGSPIELHLLPTDAAGPAESEKADEDFDRTDLEATLVAQRIHDLLGTTSGKPRQITEKDAAGNFTTRPIRYGDIVILLRSLKFKADQYAEILRESGIPVHSESGTGYFESMEVRDILALLSILDNQRQDIPLTAVLRSPLVGLAHPEDCLARIRLAYKKGPEPVPFHQAVVRYARDHDDELAAALTAFLRQLDDWRTLAHQRPLAEVIWSIYDQTGYLAFCAGLADGEQRTANLVYLHERARQFGAFHRQGVARFIQFLQSLQTESDLGQPSIASEADDVVRIMSVHRSKGLEFPVVILPDLGKAINVSDTTGNILLDRDAYLGMSVVDEARRVRYPSLASMLVQRRLRRQSLAEELRVLYVAMTRAKEHLILVGTCGAEAPDRWAARWAGHRGPFPADAVLGARAILDWVGPVAAALSNQSPGEHVEIVRHDAAEIAAWPSLQEMRASLSPIQDRLAKLQPLEQKPVVTDMAREVIERLTTRYGHEPFTKLAAAQSVSHWTKEGRLAPVGFDAEPTRTVEFAATLPMPASLATESTPSATDIGSATHLLLQHVDFGGECDVDGLRRQIDELVATKRISAEQAKQVDVEAVCWMMGSEVGQLARRHAKVLRRELPFYFARPAQAIGAGPASDDPMDQIMIRGRLDVLVPTPDGLVLADYKTDRVSPERVAERADFYRPQMQLYKEGIERIARKPMKDVYLVFLSPRAIVKL